jgi:S-adenosylmethionine:tRNA ribosyltransferase-isomerase
MLVSAFSGPATVRAAYAHAISVDYRFYSYGDACLLHRPENSAHLGDRENVTLRSPPV